MEFELWVQIATARGIVNTDPQSLLGAANCYLCFGGTSTFQAMKLALLALISKNHNAANQTDPASLMSQSQCFACFGNTSEPKLMELALLAQIAS